MVYIYLIDTVCLSGLDGKTIYFLDLSEMDGKAHIYKMIGLTGMYMYKKAYTCNITGLHCTVVGLDGKAYNITGLIGSDGKAYNITGLVGLDGKAYNITGLVGLNGKAYNITGLVGLDGKTYNITGLVGLDGKAV